MTSVCTARNGPAADPSGPRENPTFSREGSELLTQIETVCSHAGFALGPERHHTTAVSTQGHRRVEVGILEVRGEDAPTWLQGQVTADVLGAKSPLYTLLLSPNGRVISDGWIVPIDDESLDFIVPAHAADAALERLERYLVMEDVELTLRHAEMYQRLGHPPEAEPHGARWDEATWERARIEAGIPQHGRDFGADTLPQEAGLERAISFGKGCYIGQEPVVMLQHRGQPPRRLVRARVRGTPELPAPVLSEGSVVGSLTSAAGDLGLALIKRKRLDGDLRVGDQPLEVLAILGHED